MKIGVRIRFVHSLLICVIAALIHATPSYSQFVDSEFTESEDQYVKRIHVGNSSSQWVFSYPGVKYTLESGDFSVDDRFWNELYVVHNEERFDFRVARYGPGASQLAYFDENIVQEWQPDTPFRLKVEVIEKRGLPYVGADVLVLLAPTSELPSCASSRIPIALSKSNISFITCAREDGEPVEVEIEWSSSPRYGMNYFVRRVGGLERIGRFRPSDLRERDVSVKHGDFTLKITNQDYATVKVE